MEAEEEPDRTVNPTLPQSKYKSFQDKKRMKKRMKKQKKKQKKVGKKEKMGRKRKDGRKTELVQNKTTHTHTDT